MITVKLTGRCNMRTIEINKNDSGQRLDKFLTKRFKTMPLPLMYKYIRTKYIKLNGKSAKYPHALKRATFSPCILRMNFLTLQYMTATTF